MCEPPLSFKNVHGQRNTSSPWHVLAAALCHLTFHSCSARPRNWLNPGIVQKRVRGRGGGLKIFPMKINILIIGTFYYDYRNLIMSGRGGGGNSPGNAAEPTTHSSCLSTRKSPGILQPEVVFFCCRFFYKHLWIIRHSTAVKLR